MELKCLLLLFTFGYIADIGHGADMLHSRDVFMQIKRELRNELLSELRDEIRNEVQAQVRDAIQVELKTVLQDAARAKSAEKDKVQAGKKYNGDKSIVDLLKEVVRGEVSDGIGNKVKDELRQKFPEIIASLPAKDNSSRSTDSTQLRNQRNNQIAPMEVSNRAADVLLNLNTRAFTYRPVAFSVYLDHIMDHVSKGVKVAFNKPQLNENNVFNVHTGTFTAPVSGVYLFHFEFIGWARKTELKLIVDTAIVATSVVEHQASTSYLVKAGSMTLVRVNAGQAVWVEVFGNDDAQVIASDSDKSASFLGVLLY